MVTTNTIFSSIYGLATEYQVVQYIEYGDGDAQDADAGHGTHVASSIAGEVLPEWEAVQCPQVHSAIMKHHTLYLGKKTIT